MTILEQMRAAYGGDSSRESLKAALLALRPTETLLHRMMEAALSGPQESGKGPVIYPGLMLRAAIEFIVEEKDREPEDDGGDAAGDTSGREAPGERGVLQGHAEGEDSEPAGAPGGGAEG